MYLINCSEYPFGLLHINMVGILKMIITFYCIKCSDTLLNSFHERNPSMFLSILSKAFSTLSGSWVCFGAFLLVQQQNRQDMFDYQVKAGVAFLFIIKLPRENFSASKAY